MTIKFISPSSPTTHTTGGGAIGGLFSGIFGIVGFFLKLVSVIIMVITLMTGLLMSVAIFFGFKKLSGRGKKRQTPFKPPANGNGSRLEPDQMVVETTAEAVEPE